MARSELSKIAIGINDHNWNILQAVFEVIPDFRSVDFTIVGHIDFLNDFFSNSEFSSAGRTVTQDKIILNDTVVNFKPCHTVTPAEVWAGQKKVPPGNIIINSLEVAVKLGMEFKVSAVVFLPISVTALSDRGFLYDSLKTILSDWTRCDIDHKINTIDESHYIQEFTGLPFRAFSPYPAEMEKRTDILKDLKIEMKGLLEHALSFIDA